MSTRIARIVTITTVLAGLIVTGCSSPDSHRSATDSPTKSGLPVITGTPTTPTSPTTTTEPVVASSTPAPTPAPTTPATPAPTPTPTPTLGEPPVSVVPPFIIVPPIDFSLFVPRVETISGTPTFSCLEAALAGYVAVVSWHAVNTTQVRVAIDGVVVATGQPADGEIFVPLTCSDTQMVTVTPLWGDGADGVVTTYKIKVYLY